MSGSVNVAFRDQTAQFFNTKAAVFGKVETRAAQHALGSGVIPSLRVDWIKVGQSHARDVVALRTWSNDQTHGFWSTSLMGMWIPFTERQVCEGDVNNVDYIFTAELTGCTLTARRAHGTLHVAHIAADYAGNDRAARIAGADFVYGPGQYDARMPADAVLYAH